MSTKSETVDVSAFLKNLFDHAVQSAMPENCLPAHLPKPPRGRTLVVAIGKAAATMSSVVEKHWPEDAPLSGIALTRYGHGCKCDRIEVVEASHPVPDNRGFEMTQKIVSEVKCLGADDLLLFLVSGGGSALMTAPAEGISLDEKQAINKALLMSGAPIGEMNVVRKHLSEVKGGRLAMMAAPARVVSLAISDVPGDDPSTIASGPTVPDSSTLEDAIALLSRYNIETSDAVSRHLSASKNETPKDDDPVFDKCHFEMVAKPNDMMQSALEYASAANVTIQNLGADIEGEAKEIARQHAEIILQNQNGPKLLLSGGETTVTVEREINPGKGGRNCEYLLALAIALDAKPKTYAIAADTDGIDGSETNAGAIITPDTLARGRSMGLDAQDYLNRHDSFSYFETLGDLIFTGPTGTNVNDLRAIWTEC